MRVGDPRVPRVVAFAARRRNVDVEVVKGAPFRDFGGSWNVCRDEGRAGDSQQKKLGGAHGATEVFAAHPPDPIAVPGVENATVRKRPAISRLDDSR